MPDAPTNPNNPHTRADITRKSRDYWSNNPVSFIKGTLHMPLWSAQCDILRALISHPRVAVRSCNGSGKTYAAASAVIWWLMSFEHSIAITTAPTGHQVKDLLWREIARIHHRHTDLIGGVLNKMSLEIDERKYALGLSTDSMERLQGFHEKNILFVVDEASGVSEFIFEAIEGCMTSNRARLLIIGNPTRRSGTFFEAFHSEREHWFNLHISALDTPNLALQSGTGEVPSENFVEGLVTPQWVDSARKRWGVNNPTYQIRVLGDFPSQSIDTLLSLVTVEAAVQQASTPNPDPTGPDAAADLPNSTRPAQDGAEPASGETPPTTVAAIHELPDSTQLESSQANDALPILPSPLAGEDQGEGNNNPAPSTQSHPDAPVLSLVEGLEGSTDFEMPVRQAPTTIGVDVARFGTDSTVIAIRKGDQITELHSFNNQDTMATTGRVVAAIREHNPDAVYIDDVGVGGGVVDRLVEQDFKNIIGVNVGRKSDEPEKFANLRAQYFDHLRERFQAGKIIIPNDPGLIAQLTSIRYTFTSIGQMKLEDKDSLRRQGLASPDKADAIMLAFAAHDNRDVINVW